MASARARLWLLTAGAVVGLSLATTGLLDRRGPVAGSLPPDVIARVGGRSVSRERFLELLNDLAADKRATISAADRRFVLERLVDEELLVQRGIELGLQESSPAVRKAIASGVIAQIAAEAEARSPTEADLRRLYDSDPEFFTSPPRYRVRWWVMPSAAHTAGQRAAEARRRLQAGEGGDRVLGELGFRAEPALPEAPLPLTKLADYLGPELARRATSLDEGTYSAPVEHGGFWHVMLLQERRPGRLPRFSEIRPLLEAEYVRRAGDEALREYLAWLRRQTPVVINDAVLAGVSAR